MLDSLKIISEIKKKPYYLSHNAVLYHGDCFEILKQIPDNSIDMVFADPPYMLSNDGFSIQSGKMVSVNKGDWDKSGGFEADFAFHYLWISECRRVLRSNGTLWVSGTYHSIFQCGFAIQKAGYHILNDIAWFKPNAAPNLSGRYFAASHETLVWARKEKKVPHVFNYEEMRGGDWHTEDRIKNSGKQMRSVWALNTLRMPEKKFGRHPTQKPERLLYRIVAASTKPGAVILDPFAGSSTTGVAALQQGRRFIGIDKEKEYLDISKRRLLEIDGMGKVLYITK